ncbi:MAG: hypothetical protein LAN37_09780 [Acidobacteriia bacterium]|nr:hypothetical protein [Terriglobia bacterium]
MRAATTAAMVLALVAAFVSHADAEKKEKKIPDLAKLCGMDTDRASDGVFAKAHGKQWQKFASVKAVPEDADSEMAQYWRGEHGGSLVQMAVHDGVYARYHEYCFGQEGKLSSLTYETRTAHGWGFATTGTVDKNGHLVPASSRFFGVRTNMTIPRPAEADDAPWALDPRIYKRLDKLPFAKLISTPVEQKKQDAQAH